MGVALCHDSQVTMPRMGSLGVRVTVSRRVAGNQLNIKFKSWKTDHGAV